MDNINNVIGSIDDIDHVTNESDLNVLTALTDSYEKASVILENYEGDDLSSFSIFQEGTVLDEVRKQGKDDPAIVRILLFIPRLIKTMIASIGKSVKDNPIKDVVTKADKAKKDPNLLKRIISSKPVKTITLVSSVAGAIEISSTFKHMKDQIVDLANSKKSIDEKKSMREKLFESFKPTCVLDIDNNGKLTVKANCNLSGFDGVFAAYKKNIDRIIRRRFVDIRNSKDLYEAMKVLQQTFLDVLSNTFFFENIIGDPKELHDAILVSEFDAKCTKVIKEIKNDDGKYLQDLLTELTESIPYDKMKSVTSKMEMSGKMGETNINQINGIINTIVKNVKDDLRQFAKFANAIRVDLRAVIEELVKQTTNLDPEKDKKDFESNVKSAVLGKETYSKDSDGNIKQNKETE